MCKAYGRQKSMSASRSHVNEVEMSQDITLHSANYNINSPVLAGFITTYLSGSV